VVHPLVAVTAVTAAVLAVPVTLPPVPEVAATSTGSNAAAVLAGLSEAQRVGQLLMVSASLSGVSQTTKDAITRYHVGSVILAERSSAGVSAIRRMTNGLQQLATASATGGVPLFVATDQEGGYVQRLTGPGFSDMPTALDQGQLDRSVLRSQAEQWGSQLRAAGVNMNFAPVMDVVPKGFSDENLPIGYWKREFGHTPTRVANHGVSFLRGMRDAGVAPTLKHFPGLGRVTANTDYTRRVVDSVTTAEDPYLEPFLAGIDARAPFVMISEAIYTQIDPDHRAVFSHTVITRLLRNTLGFEGVVVSDSLGAASVQGSTAAERAIKFLRAGGDLLLIRGRGDAHAMVVAIRDRIATHPAFKARVDESALRVLTAKAEYGLVTC